MLKVGVWGGGEIGRGLVYRLSISPFVSDIHWINRSVQNIQYRVVDIEHGLAFAPTCRRICWYSQDRAKKALSIIDILILTLGTKVLPGGTRADLYPENKNIFTKSIVPLIEDFNGIILVVTNPVDLLTRLLYVETKINKEFIMGLGTVVETARLRASLSSFMHPRRPAREIWAYAIGTHDENFVPVVPKIIGINASIEDDILELAQREVILGAKRARSDNLSTLHPIIEGIIAVVESIAKDADIIMTVSVLDPKSPMDLFYSVPCTLGRNGILFRHSEMLGGKRVSAGLKKCKESLVQILSNAGELQNSEN